MYARKKSNHRPRRLPMRGKTAFVLAHPDDETITGAGYLARLGTLAKLRALDRLIASLSKYTRKFPRTMPLTAWRWVEPPCVYYASFGEKGNHNHVRVNEPLEKVRHDEVHRAAEILGARIEIDDIGDGELKSKEKKLEQQILSFLKKEKPNRVITFPPSGITGHPDHQAVSRATESAIKVYNRKEHDAPPIELYYRVIDPKDKGITGPYIIHDELPITHRIGVIPVLRKIRRTIEAHRSQIPEMGTIYPAFARYAKNPQPHYRGKTSKLWKRETFYRVI